jgi:hypothetical protein
MYIRVMFNNVASYGFFKIHFCKQQQTVVAAQILWVEEKNCDLGLGSTIFIRNELRTIS